MKNSNRNGHPPRNGAGAPKARPVVVAEASGDGMEQIAKKKRRVFRRPTDIVEESYYDSLAASLHEHLQRGIKTIVVTSSGAGEGKSTVTAALGRALARSGRLSVCIVDTDRYRPTLHRLFSLDNRRGLGELLRELYHLDIGRETPGQFGLGDWLEILEAQARSGELLVSDGEERFRLLFHKGHLRSVQVPSHDDSMRLGSLLMRASHISEDQRAAALTMQRSTARPLGEVLIGLGYVDRESLSIALTEQLRESLRRLLALHGPECSFKETAEAYLPATSGQQAEAPAGDMGDERVLDRLADYLKRPFLSNQIPGFLLDTTMEKLKVLPSGATPYSLLEEHSSRPFSRLLARLRRMFDVVLLDSPPVAVASPAEMLAGLADGVLMVVKADGYDAEIVQQAKNQLDRSHPNFLGVVLTQFDPRHADPMFYYYAAYQP